MSGSGVNPDDDLLASLAQALRPDAAEPPADRVAALRARAWVLPAETPVAAPQGMAALRMIRATPRWPALAAAAAVVTILVLGGVALSSATTVPVEPVALDAVPAGVTAVAGIIPHTWGTELLLVVTGLEEGERYDVAFARVGGGEVPAGTFLGVGDRPLECELNAALLRTEAIAFTVTDSAGQVVMRADLPASSDQDQ